jgi:hypothetical protein
MFVIRVLRILATLAAVWLFAISASDAAIITSDGNNTPAKATKLSAGQLVVHDNLNGNVGRPDTLLGEYDPAFRALSASDDNSSATGNGTASELVGVPLRTNGSAYFRVTGKEDTTFTGNHTQSGSYSVRYDLFDAHGVLFKTLPLEYENVAPGMVDNIWLDPPSTPEPQRAGGTVNVTINNVVGPGTGDSLDFFLFSGLMPFQKFDSLITGAEFPALLGLFNTQTRLLISSNSDAMPGLVGFADSQGRVLVGVSGKRDSLFKGEHAEVGNYTVEIIPVVVPEPSAGLLLIVGGALAGFWARRRRQSLRTTA